MKEQPLHLRQSTFPTDAQTVRALRSQMEFFMQRHKDGKPFTSNTANQVVLDAMNLSGIEYLETLAKSRK